MNIKAAASILIALALLQAAESSELPEDALTTLSFDFDDFDDVVALEEPSLEDGEEMYSSMTCSNQHRSMICILRMYYRVRDDVWYDRNCSVKFTTSVDEARIRDVRLTSLDYDLKLVSFTTYLNDTTNVQLNRVAMSCPPLESSRVKRDVKLVGDEYEVLPRYNELELIFKSGRSFEKGQRFVMRMNRELGDVSNASLEYAYEKPRNYSLFNVHAIGAAGYFLVYDFEDEAVVFTASTDGRVRRGRRIFDKRRHVYKGVLSVEGCNEVLVCAHLLDRENKKNRSCSLLDASVDVKWRVNEKVESVHEQLVDARILPGDRAILAHVDPDPRVDNSESVVRFDGVNATGASGRLFDFTERLCSKMHVQFGRIYETRGRFCFSTYCRKRLSETASVVKKWNLRCMDMALLRELELAAGNAAGVARATALIFAALLAIFHAKS